MVNSTVRTADRSIRKLVQPVASPDRAPPRSEEGLRGGQGRRRTRKDDVVPAARPGLQIDVTQCPACRHPLRPEHCEVVTSAPLMAAILAALGYPPHPPARGPPRSRGELDFDMD